MDIKGSEGAAVRGTVISIHTEQRSVSDAPVLSAGSPPGRPISPSGSPLTLAGSPEPLLTCIADFLPMRDAAAFMGSCRRALNTVGWFLYRRWSERHAGLMPRREALLAEHKQLIHSRPGASASEVAQELARATQVRHELKALKPQVDECTDARVLIHGMLVAGHVPNIPEPPVVEGATP